MALGNSEPQYQLLNGKKNYGRPIVHSMVLIGLAVLVLFVVMLFICISWRNIEYSNDKNRPIDFVVFGPQKHTNYTTSS